jgi:hypothetical protein
MKTLSDIQAPAVPVRKLLEKDVQKQCVDWARARGYWARKFSSQSQRSVPDFLFAKAEGDFKFACEFKKPGTKRKLIEKYGVTVMSTEAQYEEQEAMRAAGWYVFECDNLESFRRIVVNYEQDNWI